MKFVRNLKDMKRSRNAVPVSVIIPSTYNRVYLLKRCISALRKQTYKNFEIIVVVDEDPRKFRKFLDFNDIKVSVI